MMCQQNKRMLRYWLTTKYRQETTAAPTRITQTRNGAYRTESNIWTRNMARPGVQCDELSTRGCNKDAIIEFQLKNVRQEQTFQVLRDRKENNIVLDMPRLNAKTRRADRRNEKLQLGKSVQEKSSTDTEDERESIRPLIWIIENQKPRRSGYA